MMNANVTKTISRNRIRTLAVTVTAAALLSILAVPTAGKAPSVTAAPHVSVSAHTQVAPDGPPWG